MILIRIVVFALGAGLAAYTFYAAARTFAVPRSSANILSGLVFRSMRRIFRSIAGRLPAYEQRDGLMALYAPLSLLMLVPFWLLVTAVGFAMIYWAMGITPWQDAFIASGSSLLTLGYVGFDSLVFHLFSFSEATIGLMLVAMLIAYLPTMYSAFQQREAAVSLLEIRAGTPPTAAELIWRLYGMEPEASDRKRFWESWERIFTEIDESHTTLPALVFFRSPRVGQSWVVAAGVVLDAACDRLASQGVPVKEDRDLAWRNFAGWRVNYDSVLVALGRMTMAPEVPWLAEHTFVPPDVESGETAGSLKKVEE